MKVIYLFLNLLITPKLQLLQNLSSKITGVVFPLVLSFSLKHFVMSFKQKQQLEISVMLETLCINIVECVAV